MTKISRAKHNWSKVRQKKKVISMLKNLDPVVIQDLYFHKHERDEKNKTYKAYENEADEYRF